MRKHIPIVIIIILLVVLFHQCGDSAKSKANASQNEKIMYDSVIYFKNRLGSISSSNKTLQLTQKQLNQTIFEKDRELKTLAAGFTKLKSITKFSSTIKPDTLSTAFANPIISADTSGRFERSGTVFKDWYSLHYKITNDSLTLMPVAINTETTVITGFKRKWFLGRQVLVTDITNTNPAIKIMSIKSAQVIIPQPWYAKWYVWLAAGIAGGLFIR